MTTTSRPFREIDHIWADHPDWHADEFAEYRNRIGGLTLLLAERIWSPDRLAEEAAS